MRKSRALVSGPRGPYDRDGVRAQLQRAVGGDSRSVDDRIGLHARPPARPAREEVGHRKEGRAGEANVRADGGHASRMRAQLQAHAPTYRASVSRS